MDQLGLFSDAVDFKQTAIDALEKLDLGRARKDLEIALAVDPYLADLKPLLRAVRYVQRLQVSPASTAIELAAAWRHLRNDGALISRPMTAIMEKLLCEHMVRQLPEDYCEFVDLEEEYLHIGYCHLVLEQPEAAHQALLDYLPTHQCQSHARLWGYFGDASFLIHSEEEANSGYLRALFTDPHAIDVDHLKRPALRALLRTLGREHGEIEALALFPTHAWLEELLTIPRGSRWIVRLFGNATEPAGPELDAAGRYHRFALCLLVEQSGLAGELNLEARVEMQGLDGALFRRYLRRVG